MHWYRKIGVFIALGVLIAVVIVITVKSKGCSEVTAADYKESVQIIETNETEQKTYIKTAEEKEPKIIEDETCDFEELAASVVKLEVFNKNGDRIGTGSGFAAYDESILITARHVIVNMDYMTATRDDGTSFRIDRTIETDENTDIAICALPEDAGLVPLTFTEELPKRGSDTSVISSQFGIANLVTKGNVCGYWETKDSTWLVFTAPVSSGSSGGPLFNEKGQVVGIVSGTYEKGQNLNIAATSIAAIELCKSLFE
ncbi:MAG: trypsin-like peptidase domain-containing protein [Lachnospiraceae bacterium]|nr:trypsin-like peptidase domain-containing protein [Lachnospiraceae bacterium]